MRSRVSDLTRARIREAKAERGLKRSRDAFLRHMMRDVPDGSFDALVRSHRYRCIVLYWEREIKAARSALYRAYKADIADEAELEERGR